MAEGYELWDIECRSCGHTVTREGGNELVGTQERWRCEKCGKRGADLRRVWRVGKKPAPSRKQKKSRTRRPGSITYPIDKVCQRLRIHSCSTAHRASCSSFSSLKA